MHPQQGLDRRANGLPGKGREWRYLWEGLSGTQWSQAGEVKASHMVYGQLLGKSQRHGVKNSRCATKGG